MFNRILQIGVVALSLGLLVALFATTPSGDARRSNVLSAKETNSTSKITTLQGESSETTAIAGNQARAILAVQGMTCAGCIAQIKSSLAGLDGIGDVNVDLANGRVTVTYDGEKLKAADTIAAAITAAGYPATLKEVLTAKQIENENRLGASKSKHYIARVGDWEISRADYDIELKHARKRYEKAYGKDVFNGDRGNALFTELKSQVTLRLIDEGVQLNEISKTEYKLSSDTLKKAFNAFLKQRSMTPDEFKRSVDESGFDYAYFLKKFENRVTINTYVEENVLTGLSNGPEAQQQYADWFRNARLLAETVYYDKDIENLVKSGNSSSGCQRSCSKGNNPAKSGCKSACIGKSSFSKTDCKNDCLRKSGATATACTSKCTRK